MDAEKMESMSIEDQRRFDMLMEMMDLGRGTLWIVKDTLLSEDKSGADVQRKSHQGLALGRDDYHSLQDTMPMLIGSERMPCTERSFSVKDVMADKPWKKVWFTVIRPGLVLPPLPLGEVLGGENANITRNMHKPSLTPAEKQEFDLYLKRQGVLP